MLPATGTIDIVVNSLLSLVVDRIVRTWSTTSSQHWYLTPFNMRKMSDFRAILDKLLKPSIWFQIIETSIDQELVYVSLILVLGLSAHDRGIVFFGVVDKLPDFNPEK